MPFQMYLPNIHSLPQTDEKKSGLLHDFSDDKLVRARAYIYRVVQSYWNRVCRNFTETPPELPGVQASLDLRIFSASDFDESSAHAFAMKLPAYYSSQVAYNLTGKYASLLPTETRGKYGIFYTPPALTGRLLSSAGEHGVDWRQCTVLDPACGGGAFLAPVAQRKQASMQNISSSERLKIIGESLQGFEIDPFAGWLSQVLTELALINDVIDAEDRLPCIIKICDALRSPVEPSSFDLVIGNPPYGRTTLSKEDRLLYQRSLYGHANLYGLFTDLALRVAKPGGIVALVTPASYLAGQYFKNLRQTIRELALPQQIDFVEKRNGTFDGVLQETVLSIHIKKQDERKTGKTNSAHILNLQKDGSLKTEAAGKFYLPEEADAPWIIPRTCLAEKLLDRLSENEFHLRDYGYRVKTGPLVWNRFRDQLCNRKVEGAVPLVWAESVRMEGNFEFSYSKRNHVPFFLPAPHQEWLLTRSACVLLQRTTSKEQEKRLVAAVLPASFIKNHGAAVIENHLNVVEPIAAGGRVIPPKMMAFLLNSPLLDQIFRCISGSVAVSAYEIEAMPLPDPGLIMRMEKEVKSGMGYKQFENELQEYYGIPS